VAVAAENGAQKSVYQHRRTAGEVLRCKKGHRSELKPDDWGKYGYASNEEVLSRPLEIDGVQTIPLPRIKRSEVSPAEFFTRFAAARRPCIIEGALDSWPAMQNWDLDRLLHKYRHTPFKVGEDDKGRKLRMKLKYFLDYMEHQKDDSPLYLFETKVEGDAQARKLLDDFEVPDLFPNDFFDLVNPHSKPPFRWWSIGPKRSGTTVHNDPLGTAAWNAVTSGRKRWVLFEPQVPVRVAKGKDVINKATEDDEAIMYFDFLLPRIKAKHPDIRVYEGIQGPGEVIFVPGDWWHGVLNLEDCVAVTQNFVGYDNFDSVWIRARRERKKLSHLWLRNMRKFAPQLHAQAMELNRRDSYRMRHERGPDSASSGDSSSSSSSSSDSSSDEDSDLDFARVDGSVPVSPWLAPVKPPMIKGETSAFSVPEVVDFSGVEAPPRKRPHSPTITADQPMPPQTNRGEEQ